jgi:hypothetical protein
MEGWIYICIKCWSHEQKAIASLYDCRNHIGVCYYIRDFGGVEDFAFYLIVVLKFRFRYFLALLLIWGDCFPGSVAIFDGWPETCFLRLL